MLDTGFHIEEDLRQLAEYRSGVVAKGDDEAFIGTGLFGAKSVRLSVHGWECWNGSVEDEFHGHISPVLSAGDGTAGNDRRACDQGSPFHISKYQESGKVGKQ